MAVRIIEEMETERERDIERSNKELKAKAKSVIDKKSLIEFIKENAQGDVSISVLDTCYYMNTDFQSTIVGRIDDNDVIKFLDYYMPVNGKISKIKYVFNDGDIRFTYNYVEGYPSTYILINFDPNEAQYNTTKFDTEYKDHLKGLYPYKFEFLVNSNNKEEIRSYYSKFAADGDPFIDDDCTKCKFIIMSNKNSIQKHIRDIENTKYFKKWYRNKEPELRGQYRSFKTLDVIRWKYADK